jgi:hypothetical protein
LCLRWDGFCRSFSASLHTLAVGREQLQALQALQAQQAKSAQSARKLKKHQEPYSTLFTEVMSNHMNTQLTAYLDEKKNLAPTIGRAAAAAAEASPATVRDNDSRTSVPLNHTARRECDRVPHIRGKLTKSEQRQRLVLCVQQPRGNYIAQTGPGYASQ